LFSTTESSPCAVARAGALTASSEPWELIPSCWTAARPFRRQRPSPKGPSQGRQRTKDSQEAPRLRRRRHKRLIDPGASSDLGTDTPDKSRLRRPTPPRSTARVARAAARVRRAAPSATSGGAPTGARAAVRLMTLGTGGGARARRQQTCDIQEFMIGRARRGAANRSGEGAVTLGRGGPYTRSRPVGSSQHGMNTRLSGGEERIRARLEHKKQGRGG